MSKKPAVTVRSLPEVRRGFSQRGQTIAEWARANNFEPEKVYDVLRGKAKGKHGEAHDIAVTLGLKVGSLRPVR